MFYLISINVGKGSYYLAPKTYANTFTASIFKAQRYRYKKDANKFLKELKLFRKGEYKIIKFDNQLKLKLWQTKNMKTNY